MADELLWGTTRPMFRIGTNRWVLNQPCAFQDLKFPSEDIVNQSVLTGTLWEHRVNIPRIFTFTWDKLDRASCEILIDNILYADLDSTSIYLRPYFNFYKEYKVRCVNKWELERMGKTNKPYKGTLAFEAMIGTTTKPEYSSGSFNFNGSTQVNKSSLEANISGDISVEVWIKWKNEARSICFGNKSTGPNLQMDSEAGSGISFITWTTTPGAGHHLLSDYVPTAGEWIHICWIRKDTNDKYIYVNGDLKNSGSDSYGANDIGGFRVGLTGSAGLSTPLQIVRVWNCDISSYLEEIMIEALPSSLISNLKLWYDFSSGDTNDLSGNDNDGTVTGTEQYTNESFPDKGYEVLS